MDKVKDQPGSEFDASANGWEVVQFRGRLFATHPDHPFCEVVGLKLKPIRLVHLGADYGRD